MDISFVILTWNSEHYIGKCLSSLFSCLQNSPLTYEIFIVDNGSQDGSLSIIDDFKKLYSEKIKTVLLDHNTGTTYSRNLALKKTTGDYIFLLDPDTEMREGTIEKLIYVLSKDEKAGLAAPRLVYTDGSIQKSIDKFPTFFSKLFRLFFLKALEAFENRSKPASAVREVDYAISAVWVIKRKLLDYVGLLDENIFYAPEDVDYCLRIWKKGYKILYVPEVSVIHHAQEISRSIKINHAAVNHVKGLIYYFRKHRYFIRRPKFRNTHVNV